MEGSGDIVQDECAEVLVRTRGARPGSSFEEAADVDRGMSSFETLVRTAMALEEDPRDEHSYSYTEKKRAFEGKEKDHCYSTNSKLTHRRVQSLSDENLYRSAESNFPEDSCLVLPHYQSKDSALDVTGFDSISEKCLSYDNINVKTVDVVTEKCILPGRMLPGRILPGFSDPDISKMTLQNDESMERPSSVPNSPPSNDIQLTIEHSYYKNNKTLSKQKPFEKTAITTGTCITKESPLFDHSYDTSQKRKSLPSNTGLKRGRSSEKIESFDGYCSLKPSDLTKSPFLDQSYQSFDLRKAGKRQNIRKKFHPSAAKANEKSESRVVPEEEVVSTDDAASEQNANFSKQLLHDHAYEKVGASGDTRKRNRSSSLSEMISTRNTGLKTDHSYTVPNDTTCMEDDISANDSSLSDSGTESLNEDEEENMRTTFESLVAFHDHSYVTKNEVWQKMKT